MVGVQYICLFIKKYVLSIYYVLGIILSNNGNYITILHLSTYQILLVG